VPEWYIFVVLSDLFVSSFSVSSMLFKDLSLFLSNVHFLDIVFLFTATCSMHKLLATPILCNVLLQVLISCVHAGAIADLVKATLGPKGMVRSS
jgi:hypothetical protein